MYIWAVHHSHGHKYSEETLIPKTSLVYIITDLSWRVRLKGRLGGMVAVQVHISWERALIGRIVFSD